MLTDTTKNCADCIHKFACARICSILGFSFDRIRMESAKCRLFKKEPQTSSPVVHGAWVVDEAEPTEYGQYEGYIMFHCPFCNEEYDLENGQYGWVYGDDIPFNFCHNCGVKMDLEVKDA